MKKMKEELTLHVLSRPDKKWPNQFSKREIITVRAFFYDEDVLWLDLIPGKKRIGISWPSAQQLRQQQIDEMEASLVKLRKKMAPEIKKLRRYDAKMKWREKNGEGKGERKVG